MHGTHRDNVIEHNKPHRDDIHPILLEESLWGRLFLPVGPRVIRVCTSPNQAQFGVSLKP